VAWEFQLQLPFNFKLATDDATDLLLVLNLWRMPTRLNLTADALISMPYLVLIDVCNDHLLGSQQRWLSHAR
jgi:hypothetical protein